MSILGEQIASIHDRTDKIISEIRILHQYDNTKGKENSATTSMKPTL